MLIILVLNYLLLGKSRSNNLIINFFFSTAIGGTNPNYPIFIHNIVAV
jgi:hypothetical protein